MDRSSRWPLFDLGPVLITPAAGAALAQAGVDPDRLLARYQSGEWGDLPPADVAVNERSLKHGGRFWGRYALASGAIVWVSTAADGCLTTVFLAEEY